MTIRFAAATTGTLAARALPACRPIARALIARSIERVSNDNGPSPAQRSMNDQILSAALRHFAEHGMGAARVARAQAQAAVVAKDRQSFDWWLGITRTLDRRLAREVERLAPEFA
ncbi:MAG: hypothetical protein HRT64_00815 [Erythrobacter sp.]|nr:hypothetical protein [Erythrobacter sp.]